MSRAVVAVGLLVALAGCSLLATPLGNPAESTAVDSWETTTFVVGLEVQTDGAQVAYAAALRNATFRERRSDWWD